MMLLLLLLMRGKEMFVTLVESHKKSRDLFIVSVYLQFMMQVTGGVLYLNGQPQPGMQV